MNAKLQDFTSGATARGQISFGDVRRLQRDCLPEGITTREEAASLIALDAALVRADKAWAAWLVPALADFVTAQQRADADAVQQWLRGFFAQSPSSAALGRKLARHMRELVQAPASGSGDAQPRARRTVRTCKLARVAEKSQAPVVRSGMAVRRARHGAPPSKCPTAGTASPPCELWSPGLMEKHWRFQLARPAA